MKRRLLAVAAALLLVGGAAGSATAAGSAPAAVASVQVPSGVTAGVAVFDRQTGAFTEQVDASAQFRSASVVKLLLALDFLWNRGPDYTVPAADRARLEPMLRSSNDDTANYYWSTYGGSAIVNRMVSRLGLQDTAPPPAGYEGYWGYTAISARDTVAIYRYLLDSAPAPVRDFVMGNLRQSTRCASDGFDQHFGIAGAFDKPWAVKQGWAGSSYPEGTCTNATAAPASTRVTAAAVDLTRPALHSTGTVGAGDRSIVAVYTLHPVGTSYGKAYTDIGRLTRSLNVPGATRPGGWWYGTWSEHVNVRRDPSTGNAPMTQLPAGVEVLIGCQKRGQEVQVPPYTNDWWAYLPQYGGWISNIYVSSPDNRIPGVREC
ncbi:SH3 domain-containing protein [Streptomyces acidiscabies]|uniref:SH3 domain-containing protein n=1 Tax=Streptomyces acidiscabies TaxID=42234 RepID=A0AAP6BI03_9ACTN|nr:SH3 domain-containing protein [Streptomyces acidiscabies]MBP5934920.1 hypothetical protein [Streptomyces sp. LBUM 1476]MBZ3917312.1 SH3 domain-containing protein [Streptomyces acidiscabies]MDX2964837.1 SH3 domain-containing protein [Streptomyces acidiscabies]MDX3023338.1 SH3 domain-containing protein [Streptomyces acidiscabies]MDX3796554.1 SH3 domain-containing protein [Streptomyces acidiscabies]